MGDCGVVDEYQVFLSPGLFPCMFSESVGDMGHVVARNGCSVTVGGVWR